MGLIALVGLLLAAAGLVGCGILVFFFLRLIISRTIFRWILFLPTTIVLFIALWAFLNANNLQAQSRMNSLGKDCGWAVYKTAQGVDGLYVEQTGFRATDSGVSPLLIHNYDTETLNDQGQILHAGRDEYPGQPIAKRTFHYGIRNVQESIYPDIVRTTETLLDFDTNEVYAKNVEYWFSSNNTPSNDISTLIFFFVAYHPSGCGEVRSEEEEKRIKDVFPP